VLAPESSSSQTVSVSKPDPRRIDVYSVGRFSSTGTSRFDFQHQIPCALARQLSWIRQRRVDIRVRQRRVVPQYLFAPYTRCNVVQYGGYQDTRFWGWVPVRGRDIGPLSPLSQRLSILVGSRANSEISSGERKRCPACLFVRVVPASQPASAEDRNGPLAMQVLFLVPHRR
jgi:hypothetical protein